MKYLKIRLKSMARVVTTTLRGPHKRTMLSKLSHLRVSHSLFGMGGGQSPPLEEGLKGGGIWSGQGFNWTDFPRS